MCVPIFFFTAMTVWNCGSRCMNGPTSEKYLSQEYMNYFIRYTIWSQWRFWKSSCYYANQYVARSGGYSRQYLIHYLSPHQQSVFLWRKCMHVHWGNETGLNDFFNCWKISCWKFSHGNIRIYDKLNPHFHSVCMSISVLWLDVESPGQQGWGIRKGWTKS